MDAVATKSPLLAVSVVLWVLAALVAVWAWVSATQVESAQDASAGHAYFWVAAVVAVVGVALFAVKVLRRR